MSNPTGFDPGPRDRPNVPYYRREPRRPWYDDVESLRLLLALSWGVIAAWIVLRLLGAW